MAGYTAGGYKLFGPTYNSTAWVRLGYEGLLGSKPIGSSLITIAEQGIQEPNYIPFGPDQNLYPGNYPLAGKIAALDNQGNLTLAGSASAVVPLGLFREDFGDMVNASNMGTYYFGFGEYYVSEVRLDPYYVTAGPQVGDQLTYTSSGLITKSGNTFGAGNVTTAATGAITVGFATFVGMWPQGNMYANAGLAANGGTFVGFQLIIQG